MSIILRAALLFVSVVNFIWVMLQIRKAQVRIEDTVFWILFSGLLIILSVFPRLTELGAQALGIMSPVNFIFLAIIFVLLIKVFRLSIKISFLENKISRFVQFYAINHHDDRTTKHL